MVALENAPDAFEMDMSAVAIGKVILVGIPGEPFAGIGFALKETPGWDMILVARHRVGTASWKELNDGFLKLCQKLVLLEDKP